MHYTERASATRHIILNNFNMLYDTENSRQDTTEGKWSPTEYNILPTYRYTYTSTDMSAFLHAKLFAVGYAHPQEYFRAWLYGF